MPLFGDVEKLVDLFLAELPQGMFAQDRADNSDPSQRSVSSSDIRAQMQILSVAYTNLLDIYNDKFASTVELDAVSRWEKELFPDAQDSSQPLSVRQNNLIAKLRASGGISYSTIHDIIDSLLTPAGFAFDLVTFTGQTGGGWVFEESELDVSTYLASMDPLRGAIVTAPLNCSFNYSAAGLTPEQLVEIQETAYTYEVRIYGTAPSGLITQLDLMLTQFEPARSTHNIYNNFPGPVAP
jgi:hypothetical protein